MPAHEWLVYVLAVVVAAALPVAIITMWMLRRDIHRLRLLYSTLIEAIARHELTLSLTVGDSPELSQQQPPDGTQTPGPADS